MAMSPPNVIILLLVLVVQLAYQQQQPQSVLTAATSQQNVIQQTIYQFLKSNQQTTQVELKIHYSILLVSSLIAIPKYQIYENQSKN